MTGMEPIAHIHTDLPQKFGIPRNSFLAPHLQGRIVFEPEFASNAAVEGLDSFSHLWLLWRFENGTPGGTAKDIAADAKTRDRSGTNAKWSKTVRPPRLGGAERVGEHAGGGAFADAAGSAGHERDSRLSHGGRLCAPETRFFARKNDPSP